MNLLSLLRVGSSDSLFFFHGGGEPALKLEEPNWLTH
jgi:hypothetical protein